MNTIDITNIEDMCNVMGECLSYLLNCESEGEVEGYKNALRDFVKSGLFHDAIGKIDTFEGDKVTFLTEY